MPTRNLQVTRSQSSTVAYAHTNAYRMTVTVADQQNTGTDPNIFLFHRRTVFDNLASPVDEFVTVANPVDLEYPVNAPDLLNFENAFFRRNSVTLDFRTTAEMEETWQELIAAIASHIDALKRLDSLSTVQTLNIGDTP